MARANHAQPFAYKCALPPRSVVWDPLSRETPSIPRHLGSARAISPKGAQNITFGNFPMLPQIPNYQCCACIFFGDRKPKILVASAPALNGHGPYLYTPGALTPSCPPQLALGLFLLGHGANTSQASRTFTPQSSIYISLGSVPPVAELDLYQSGRVPELDLYQSGTPQSSIYISLGLPSELDLYQSGADLRARSISVWV